MAPFIARLNGSDEDLLVVGFVGTETTAHAVFVKADGSMSWVPVTALRVERGNEEWPLGYAFSRVALEAFEASSST